MDDESFAFVFQPIMKEVMERFQPEAVVLQRGEGPGREGRRA